MKNKKKYLSVFLVSILLILTASISFAIDISLYVDAAPNVYGSPDYAPWQTDTFAQVANGTFINMSNGVNPANVGTTDFEIQDEVVYSFGDLGRRLTWIYWIPDFTIGTLTSKFSISLFNTWDGVTSDFYDDYYGSTWLEPTQWVNYDMDGDGDVDGVIGTAGMAWWGAYGVNTQAALDADITAWGSVDETWVFTTRYEDGTTTPITNSITSNRTAVPEPGTVLLMGLGILGLAGYRRKRSKEC